MRIITPEREKKILKALQTILAGEREYTNTEDLSNMIHSVMTIAIEAGGDKMVFALQPRDKRDNSYDGRCASCKYYNEKISSCCRRHDAIIVGPRDFCSYGAWREKQEDGQDGQKC